VFVGDCALWVIGHRCSTHPACYHLRPYLPATAASVWNSLPESVLASSSLTVFCSRPKTEHFTRGLAAVLTRTIISALTTTCLFFLLLLHVLAVLGLYATLLLVYSSSSAALADINCLFFCSNRCGCEFVWTTSPTALRSSSRPKWIIFRRFPGSDRRFAAGESLVSVVQRCLPTRIFCHLSPVSVRVVELKSSRHSAC